MQHSDDVKWNPAKKIFFRFACLYIVLYVFAGGFTFIPGFHHMHPFFNSVGEWFGTTFLGIEGPINTDFTGSGDRLIDYLNLLVFLILSVAGTAVWSLADRHRKHYEPLVYWICLLTRYYLFAVFFAYGIVKVIKTQFPYPDLWRLLQPFGDASPMGLAWTFMGFSKPYTVFAGLMEMIPALLLLFRKTTSPGALLALGVATHIVVMNFSYDIPVKLFSTHLAMFSLFLLSFDGKRLLKFLVLNQPVAPANHSRVLPKKNHHYAGIGLKILFAGLIIVSQTTNTWGWYQQMHDRADTVLIYGLWEVNEFIKNREEIPPLVTDEDRWRYLIFEYPDRASAISMTGERLWYSAGIDTTRQTISLNRMNEALHFEYEKNEDELVLFGERENEMLSINLQRIDPEEHFRLVKQGFNWIHEFPYNR